MSTASLAPDKREARRLSQALPSAGRLSGVALATCLVLASLVVLLSYAVVATAHLSDRYQVNFISGIYTTLAARFNDGTFYPELYDGEHYGGTRYMPLPFVLQAVLARLTGDYLVAGKLLTYGLAAALCVQLLLILKR